nr:hypothetical protein 14 [bacterium]
MRITELTEQTAQQLNQIVLDTLEKVVAKRKLRILDNGNVDHKYVAEELFDQEEVIKGVTSLLVTMVEQHEEDIMDHLDFITTDQERKDYRNRP